MVRRIIKNNQKNTWNCFIKIVLSFFVILFYVCYYSVNAKPIHIIAAENMYGNIAQQIGGNTVQVDAILNNPDEDPHLFELTPHSSQKINQADFIIINGLGYDSWIDRLLNSFHIKNNKVISVQNLLNRASGSNPHLWYDLQAVKNLANELEHKLAAQQPENKSLFIHNRDLFLNEIKQIDQRIQRIRALHSQLYIAATESVFGLMAKNMGFIVLEEPYQWVVMNGGEPTPQQIAQFTHDLKTHKIQILVYNNQVSNNATENLKSIALEQKIPVIGVEEIMPPSLSYQKWINHILDKLESVLQRLPQ